MDTHIDDDVTVGHNAVIHACTLKNRAFIGISATVLDGAVIEEGGMLGAGGLLTPGKVIGPNELWTGAPAKLRRVMDEDERKHFGRNATVYRDLARQFRAGLKVVG
jgi:carbonic anhydrase/acetyltransferase-like protein (isoleucine patch superfamily)